MYSEYMYVYEYIRLLNVQINITVIASYIYA